MTDLASCPEHHPRHTFLQCRLSAGHPGAHTANDWTAQEGPGFGVTASWPSPHTPTRT